MVIGENTYTSLSNLNIDIEPDDQDILIETDIEDNEEYEQFAQGEEFVSNKYLKDSMSAYLKDIAKYDVLPDEELFELARRSKKGDMEARDKIFLHNLRLVVFVAKQYMQRVKHLSELDLIMEGNIGLHKAVDKFDPELGYKFSTYAYNWIRQSITRAIMDYDNTIRVPVHVYENVSKYIRCIEQYKQETGSEFEPPREYVKEKLGFDDYLYDNVMNAYKHQSVDSLNRQLTVDGDNTSELIEFIVDENFDIAESVEHTELVTIFDELIERYLESRSYQGTADRNREILYMRLGLHGNYVHTLDEVGKKFGVTRERVRQVEANFIKFCRLGKHKAKLREFLD